MFFAIAKQLAFAAAPKERGAFAVRCAGTFGTIGPAVVVEVNRCMICLGSTLRDLTAELVCNIKRVALIPVFLNLETGGDLWPSSAH